jgi:SAM-dependent methyltransferase
MDIDDVLEDVARALYERETGRSQTYHSEVREVEDITYLLPGAWQNISDSLVALDQSLSPLEAAPTPEKLPLLLRGSGALKRLAKRTIERAVYWYVNPIVAQLHRMHSATDRTLHEVTDLLRTMNDRIEALEKADLVGRMNAVEGERLDERIRRLEREWRQRLAAGSTETTTGGERADAASAPVPRSAGVGKERRIERAPGTEPYGPLSPFHFDYYWFESIHRGDRALIKRRQHPYLEYFKGCENVLDVGCGRGEFLELMSENGIKGYGIDIESDAVHFCNDAGLEAEQADAIEHLNSLEDETLDGVFISQVAEHMTPTELIELVGLAHQKMKPKGCIVIETPNPQCLLIFASFFYADLSHVQPIHPETMRFLLLSAGFRDVEVKFTNPVPRNQRLARLPSPGDAGGEPWMDELNRNLEKLNSVLFGYLDYASIGRK